QRKSRAAIVPPGSIRSRKPKAGSRPSPVLPPYAQADGIAAAHDGDQDDGAACVLNGARDFVDVAHRAAVDLEDHVATDEPGALGFAARRDFDDDRAALIGRQVELPRNLRRDRLDGHADAARLGAARRLAAVT